MPKDLEGIKNICWVLTSRGQFRAAFKPTDPKSTKKAFTPSVFFALLEFACVKFTRKMLVKSTPAFQCIGPLLTLFLLHISLHSYQYFFPKKTANRYLKMDCSYFHFDLPPLSRLPPYRGYDLSFSKEKLFYRLLSITNLEPLSYS